ncbi:MAG: hypothetical protein ABI547_05715 [Betaproteobacteria bacterium]
MFPRKKPAELDECPYGCARRDASNQRLLRKHELARLSPSARRAVGRTLGRALICENCGGVHLREPHANVPLGILDGVSGPGWHSHNFA